MPRRRPAIRSPMCSDISSTFTIRVSRLVLRLAIQLDLKFPNLTRCCQTHRQSPLLPSFTSTPRSEGPFLRRHYPASTVLWPSPTPRFGRRPFWRRSGPRPPTNPEPPSLTQITFSACRAQYPGGPDQVLVGWRVARSRAGFFPVRAAFPITGAGRRPHHYFRGLLKLHTRYDLPSCSPTIRGLCREAPPWPVTRLGRSPATKFNQQPPWVGPSPTGDLRR